MQLNLNNRIFQAALQKASRILGKPGRLALLLVTFGRKLNQTKFTKADSSDVKEKFFTLDMDYAKRKFDKSKLSLLKVA